MKVTVDYDVCASTGTCVQACPEVFEIRADGFLYLLSLEAIGAKFRAVVTYRGSRRSSKSSPIRVNYWHWQGLSSRYYTAGSGSDALGFNNDASPARYNKAAADAAWKRTIEWFNMYVKK